MFTNKYTNIHVKLDKKATIFKNVLTKKGVENF
jgi:hypothetical protein